MCASNLLQAHQPATISYMQTARSGGGVQASRSDGLWQVQVSADDIKTLTREKLDELYRLGIVDDANKTIPGFELEKCTLRNEDRCDMPLKWNDASARQLAGRTVRRVDRLLRLEDAERASARHQGNLPSKQPDHSRLPSATTAGGTGALSRRDAIGVA